MSAEKLEKLRQGQKREISRTYDFWLLPIPESSAPLRLMINGPITSVRFFWVLDRWCFFFLRSLPQFRECAVRALPHLPNSNQTFQALIALRQLLCVPTQPFHVSGVASTSKMVYHYLHVKNN
jgi:hypothetical protein